MASKVVNSNCLGCVASCGAIYHVENNRIVKVKGDRNHPLTYGYLCPKGLAVEEVRSHRDRLRHPLKRVGERGEGKWKQISWDEAIGEIADKFGRIKEKYGAEAVVLNVGYSGIVAGLDPYIGKFVHEFGTPNRMVVLYICEMPAFLGGIYTCGFPLVSGMDFRNSKCIVLWGLDADVSWRGFYHADIQEARRNGAKLIIVDPRRTPLAADADIWMQVRPATDCALALGMLNVVINEGLYDREFIDKWAVGFDELKQHVQEYSPQRVAEITWVPAETIVEAARMYAQNKPGCIGQGGGGLCHSTNTFQTNRAIALLVALIGNIDVPGSHIDYTPLLRARGTMAAGYDVAFGKLGEGQIRKRLGPDKFRLVAHEGRMDAHPSAVWPAITERRPYPIKAMLSIAANVVAAAEDSRRVWETLNQLDFFAISELFMTPTAEIADIVLPIAHWSERDEIVDAYTKNYVFCHPKIVEPPEECWEDGKILVELARKLGTEGYWNSVEEALNYRLERLGITFEEFKEKGMVQGPVEYKKYEKFKGFKTESKRIDLYSDVLDKLGYDPMPVHKEPPESPVSTPELAREYPLVLITGSRIHAYFHSSFRNIPRLRKTCPEPLIDIHPDTAKEMGIEDGDWVQIETQRGSIKHKARFNEWLHPRVVSTPHGWWYGYKDGWKEVNINILTDSSHYDPHVGSAPLKGLLCRVKKAEAPPLQIG